MFITLFFSIHLTSAYFHAVFTNAEKMFNSFKNRSNSSSWRLILTDIIQRDSPSMNYIACTLVEKGEREDER